jgi:hypothetical protein
MPRSRQKARISASQPFRAKQRFWTKAGGIFARSQRSASWSRSTLLTPMKRVWPAAWSASMAAQTARSDALSPMPLEGPCST